VTIYSRPIKILGYADDFTASRLASTKSRTLALIVPEAISQVGLIIDTINKNRFIIGRLRMVQLTAQQAATFFNDRVVTERAASLAKGPIVALEVIGSGVNQALKDLAGITPPTVILLSR
jgi:nucleoside-diphosphate kinase